ncbi:acyl-CoA dehydrogenase family protein [Mycobacterium vicinigordonae]|uniref:Acyl-CoA dehydrogenase family protein n=1 Tax=Mycobacterium vicinigordonae TaxID=1719132 RepID=A0A7D6E7Q0_9MYCO|nr:acyl-CoA dehydrogenase family protein [Mycobacterium vicinigordonae]QLL09102.1 acyl-CoA dehydrogenase family protein [Mycobacterium vicinigordonae]
MAPLGEPQPDAAGSIQLRQLIRDFIQADAEEFGWEPEVDSWLGQWDPAFSQRLARAGFLGLTIPRRYGGRGLSHLDRYVVTEELLAAGAPIAAHWVADRQFAPSVLVHGTEEQRQRWLPEIAAGHLYTALGFSEPGAGSDLAAAQTKAARTDGGWLLRGTKVWTSGAHHAHLIAVLARTSPPDPKHRHAGFTEFLIARETPGVVISAVELMSGEHHFNEVTFDDAFVPDTDVLGEVGNGWAQVTSELSVERSGPERFLSTAPLITTAVGELAQMVPDDGTAAAVGALLAELMSLRQLSMTVSEELQNGHDAASRAALVKDMGTEFEQRSVDVIAELLADRTLSIRLQQQLATALLHKPLFTLRGGTNEVLRGVVARRMGLR